LGYPGGPAIEATAKKGDPTVFDLPRPLTGDGGCDFSFSGLKTALRVRATQMQPVSETDVANLSASLQQAITDCLVERSQNAMKRFSQDRIKPSDEISNLKFVVAGGVAANTHIKSALAQICDKHDFEFHVAPPHLCTDNAAMIAWAGA
jgi:N6-L-threonylcarbamoyladenine synthase